MKQPTQRQHTRTERGAKRSRSGVLITLRRRMRGDESGQALVEFAIVVPLIVTVFLFAQWGWELVQIKLKIQEAARFAAWEATAYPLHDYDKGKADGFSKMRTSVMAETMMRYGDLNSATNIPSGLTIWSATWTPPVVMITNGQEEMIYGGGIVNLIFNIVSQVGALIAGLLYSSQNVFALSLITSASWKSSGSGAGKALAGLFGPTEWGFNKSGYITARVGTYVQNNWFNIRLIGKQIFSNPGLLIYESHGVLADSWRLNKSGDKAWKKGSDSSPGFSSGAMYKQVERMYLMTKTTRGVAKGMFASMVYSPMMASLGGSLTSMPPALGDFIKPSVVMGSYKGGQQTSGQISLREDVGTRKYDSSPMRGAYADSLKQRGEHFMGCKEAEKLGCTDTLSQDNPFGDYIVRE
jgi:hypothetical protein